MKTDSGCVHERSAIVYKAIISSRRALRLPVSHNEKPHLMSLVHLDHDRVGFIIDERLVKNIFMSSPSPSRAFSSSTEV
jgi:hypothetical protein